MLEGVMLLWFLLTALSLLYVVIDIRTTPASPVLKWRFILLTAYTGPPKSPIASGLSFLGGSTYQFVSLPLVQNLPGTPLGTW